jgi:hypothetical protein
VAVLPHMREIYRAVETGDYIQYSRVSLLKLYVVFKNLE